MTLDDATVEQYEALTTGAAWLDAGSRTRLRLAGDERAAFLHNLATNDIKSLAAGSGAESFLTDVQGKILGYVYVLVETDAIWLSTSPGQADRLLAHFDRYRIRERVECSDQTATTCEMILAGSRSAEVLGRLGADPAPENPIHGAALDFGGCRVAVWCLPLYGRCWSLVTAREHREALAERLADAGATAVGDAAADIVRVESGSPLYGIDIDGARLPQELDRNALAISFRKGCYLGQETVARIDALGHVNWLFRGLRFEGDPPEPGSELAEGNRVLARITSVVSYAPRAGAPLALAYVRREVSDIGRRVGGGTIVELPLGRPG